MSTPSSERPLPAWLIYARQMAVLKLHIIQKHPEAYNQAMQAAEEIFSAAYNGLPRVWPESLVEAVDAVPVKWGE